MIRSKPVAIVGAGPAGMSAAISLAECGIRSIVIDENGGLGGQIYRQSPSTLRSSKFTQSKEASRGLQLKQHFQSFTEKIEYLPNTKVWGVWEKQLAVTGQDGWHLIDAEHLLLATGAYEYVPPFPGWTMPGVLTPGAAQLMVKSMHIAPGRRVLIAGTGPFLLVVANALHDAGVEVAGVVESVRRSEVFKSLPRLLNNFGLLRQGWDYLRRLGRAGIPIHTGHVVVEAEGQNQVEQVRFAPCHRDWQPDLSRAKTVEVDTLCVGYGFVPRTELAQLAGCEVEWKNELGGWIPRVDEDLATSRKDVWVAGDGGGVAGAAVAEDEGRLAGLAIARRCGAIDDNSFRLLRAPIIRRLDKLRRFRFALDNLSQLRPGLSTLAKEETCVCRCEELKRGEIEPAITAGCTTYRTIKTATRIGMGRCQGRMCWPAMARFVASKTGQPMEKVGNRSVRPPIIPITLGEMAEMEPSDAVADQGRNS